MKQVNGHHFRPEELVSMRRLNRKTGEWSETEFPKVGGRLRIAHEQNDVISITSEVIQYDGQVAVVKSAIYDGAREPKNDFREILLSYSKLPER